jgi:hypothetical protein
MFASKFSPADRAMKKIVRLYGLYAGLRFVRNAGIDFEDAYFMMFGRLPAAK